MFVKSILIIENKVNKISQKKMADIKARRSCCPYVDPNFIAANTKAHVIHRKSLKF
jgi:hypothetical protein